MDFVFQEWATAWRKQCTGYVHFLKQHSHILSVHDMNARLDKTPYHTIYSYFPFKKSTNQSGSAKGHNTFLCRNEWIFLRPISSPMQYSAFFHLLHKPTIFTQFIYTVLGNSEDHIRLLLSSLAKVCTVCYSLMKHVMHIN